jgi:spore germination cell wall hydrolase CwlJ-like protein
MAVGVQVRRLTARAGGKTLGLWAPLALLIPAASCVPAAIQASAARPGMEISRAEIAAFTAPVPAAPGQAPGAPLLTGSEAFLANSAIPVSATDNPAPNAYAFIARTPSDQLRSQDCLAQAVYYEARSQSEDGQRAVAQVVLNRVRHPAWPKSVCGVVYQAGARAGGGCQFTFTCDGSLAVRPSGAAWSQAQRIAAEALAGRAFAPIGLSTFYHADYVFPAWAPQLVKTAQIGAHIFYRLPGLGGSPLAFGESYAGIEPVPHPVQTIFYRQATTAAALGEVAGAAPAPTARAGATPMRLHSDIPDDARWAATNLPDSGVRAEHAQSGQWREDAPAAVTRR